MAEQTTDLLRECMRRFDRKLSDLIDDVRELKIRMTGVDEGLAGISRRIDRVEDRLTRIARRLELSDA
ncbi:MAG: hypothetical protein HC900_02870 [Methylacidiphilales bacterium]|nr:hypothetical protein [Candidatus Methylacidiphilales bacterium]